MGFLADKKRPKAVAVGVIDGRDSSQPDKDGDGRGLDRQHLSGGDKAVIGV